ncbi:hypothetical protein HXP44_23470 [Streptomyces sioyaensis]|uniref:hypothetical protein n=1 Tax=Streptomyces sioyaensis TaxID=67364 RepID=UPI001583B924|nr:hypothetical protein [Streptomyces sioyaensis]MBM4794946.1 hypothetical protein [Streptomyces sioyaensis]
MELGGHRIEAGATVLVALASGNRDATQFSGDPNALDVSRPYSPHLAFGRATMHLRTRELFHRSRCRQRLLQATAV